jgi:hypothetical protein
VLTNQSVNPATTTAAAFTLDQGPPQPATISIPSNGLLPNPGAQVNSRARPNPLRFPEIDAWNLALQRAVTPSLTLTMAYVANKGTYTLGDGSGNTTNPNEGAITLPGEFSYTGQTLHWDPSANAGPGGTGVYNQLRRYYGASLTACKDANYQQPSDPNLSPGQCGWTNDITYYSDNLNTNFNALQVTLQQNTWKGLDYTANYQWASAFADSTNYSTWDRHAEHGRDSNVRLQQLTWYGSYELPFGKGRQFGAGMNRMADLIAGGWQISTTLSWAGGLPFSLTYNESCTNVPSGGTGCSGNAPQYPSYNGNAKMKTSLTGFQDKGGTGTRTYYQKQTSNLLTDPGNGIFKNPGLDTIGNVGKNTYIGPGFFNDDLSISKTATIRESVALKFSAYAFNAFNHISPGNPGGSIESDGTIGGGAPGYAPRQLEFMLRVQF